MLLIASVIALLIGISGFYVGSEFAIVSVRRGRIRQLAQEGSLTARALLPVVADNRGLYRAMTATQVGITATSLALGAYAQARVAALLAPWLAAHGTGGELAARSASVALTLVGVTVVQVILGEMVPKSIALRYPLRWSLAAALPLRWSQILFSWFIAVLTGSTNAVLRLLRVPPVASRGPRSPAEIGMIVAESARSGAVSRELRDGIHNALRFASRNARDVMVPRVRVRGVPLDATIPQVRAILRAAEATRLPVYRGSLDEIIGFVHAKEVLLRTTGTEEPAPLDQMIRPVMPVPWSARAGELLEKMRKTHVTVAVVLDEHGGTDGIVTLEDLIQEVIGEIEDEFEAGEPRPERLEDGRLRLRGQDPLVEVNDRFHLELRSDEARTLGGLLMETLGRIARPGDVVEVSGARLEVEGMTGRQIDSVLVTPPSPEPGGDR